MTETKFTPDAPSDLLAHKGNARPARPIEMSSSPKAECPGTSQAKVQPIASHHWHLEFPTSGAREFSQTSMTALEQMFFLGAPLAHVVQYEEKLHVDHRSSEIDRRWLLVRDKVIKRPTD